MSQSGSPSLEIMQASAISMTALQLIRSPTRATVLPFQEFPVVWSAINLISCSRPETKLFYTPETNLAKLPPDGLFGAFQTPCARIRRVVRKCAGKKSHKTFGSFAAYFGLYIFKMSLLSGVSQFRGIYMEIQTMKVIKMESAKLANLALLVKKAK